MSWTPLRLGTPLAQHVFGGTRIAELLGRRGLPPGRVAETWEVSDWDEKPGLIQDGPHAGKRLRDLPPEALTGPGFAGPRFPLLTKFIDGTGMLPVHLHADDATAQRLEGQPNGKTEAWHILWAAPGATCLLGTKPGIDRATLRDALLGQDYDAVMHRRPVIAGETIYVPGGTLHSFGPDTLIYEIEQTSDIQQHAMPTRMEDGAPLPRAEWEANIDRLLEEWRPAPQPRPHPGLALPMGEGIERRLCCAGPFFALERWRIATRHALRFLTARIVSNLGPPCRVAGQPLPRAGTLLLPAALGEAEIEGPAEFLLGYRPDLDREILPPLLAARHAPEAVAALGEGLNPPRG